MPKYIRKNKEFQHSGYKIRVIKEDLSKFVDLNSVDIIMVYKSIILEDSERLDHYQVDENDFIWFGTKLEYDQEFGSHILLELKADTTIESIDVTEKLLVKSTDKISDVRNILSRIYSWITKVKFWNSKRIQLLDDQLIEECQLIENPIIIIGSPVFRVTRGALDQIQNNSNYVRFTQMRLKPFEMSPFIEILKLITDNTNRNGSMLSKFLNFVKFENPEDCKVKRDVELFLFDWVKYYERLERNQLLFEDKISIYRQDFSDNLNDITNELELGTTDEHFQVMKNLFQTGRKLVDKYFSQFLNHIKKSLEPIFEAYSKVKVTPCEDIKSVDLRLGNRLNYFMNKFLYDGCRLSDEEFTLQTILIIPDLLPILGKVNLLIGTYWSQIYYDGQNRFRNMYVNPSLDKDKPYLILTPADITGAETKSILSDPNDEKNVFLVSNNFNCFYQDDEIIPMDKDLSAITVSKFQNFKKVETIGKGGYGTVCLYLNVITNQKTVLKKLKIPINKNIDQVNEVLREITTFSQIAQHRRIIQYIDYFIKDRNFYIEMEFMENGSLKRLLENNGALDEKQIKKFSFQILEGLKYLHEKSICHRDIKAANVLIDIDGNTKLTDFGLAKCFYESNDDLIEGIKQSGVGTERWMAPEIYDTSIYGSSADIWSFGMTMIEMITGLDPFPKLTVFGIHDRIKKYGINQLQKKVSNNLYQLVNSCLKCNSEDRDSCDQLLQNEFFM